MQNKTLDSLHRGYLSYLAETADDGCGRFRRMISRAGSAKEQFDTSLCSCHVHTDWIEEIEKTMPFIDRAVRENRQFIQRVGETVPIEKVRRVSKTSVEHLARHSELITREPEEGENVTPEKLYMTENIGTYAVYENRFLYMLLCYIKDFSEIKYQKISMLSRTFSTELRLEKTIADKQKQIEFSLRFKETDKEKGETALSQEVEDSLNRIQTVIAETDALLKTNLMTEVSSAPMLKPPIARTNVLLQNPCFSEAMKLYDYLTAYTGDGYEMKTLFESNGALPENAKEDFAELVLLTSYLSYRHGGLQEELDKRYEEELENRRKEQQKALDDRLASLKARLGETDPVTAEYILALEDKCRETDKLAQQAEDGKALAETAKQTLKQAERMQETAREEVCLMQKQLQSRENTFRQAEEKHRRELESASFRLQEKEILLQTASEEHQAEIARMRETFRAEYETLAEQYRLQTARLRAKGEEEGTVFSSKETFAELEAEYRAFEKFFDAQWKIAKKRIRNEKLSQRKQKTDQT